MARLRIVQFASSVIAVAAMSGVVAGCDSDQSPETGPSDGSPPPRVAFTQQNAAVLVWCESQGLSSDPSRVMLALVSMQDGRMLADASFDLPDQVSAPRGCVANDEAKGTSGDIRTMFDRAFERMAVLVSDEQAGTTQASTIAVNSGTLAPPPAISGGFSSAPQVGDATFHPDSGDLWYIDSATDDVLSRDAAGTVTMRGKLPEPAGRLAVGARDYWSFDRGIALVAPDGMHAIIDEGGVSSGPSLVPAGGTVDDAPSIDGAGLQDPLPGADTVSYVQPLAWVDDLRLLCRTGSEASFSLITFAPGRAAIANSRTDLLPVTNRTNFSAVPGPDGQSFAFLSRQGEQISLFRQSFAAGAEPTKVADIKPPTPTEDSGFGIPVPYLLAWQ